MAIFDVRNRIDLLAQSMEATRNDQSTPQAAPMPISMVDIFRGLQLAGAILPIINRIPGLRGMRRETARAELHVLVTDLSHAIAAFLGLSLEKSANLQLGIKKIAEGVIYVLDAAR